MVAMLVPIQLLLFALVIEGSFRTQISSRAQNFRAARSLFRAHRSLIHSSPSTSSRRLHGNAKEDVKEDVVALADKAFANCVVEYPQYKTLERRPSYKVRLYPQTVAVQVKDGTGLSFRDQIKLLADYVGVGKDENGGKREPANTGKSYVPITAPLLMPGAAVIGVTSSKMQLLLPPDFELSDAPRPLDSRLKLVEIPEHVCAIQTALQKGNLEKQVHTLVQTLQKDGHSVEHESWQVLHYRSPWFNPMFNSDEIAIGMRKYIHCRENRDTLWCTQY